MVHNRGGCEKDGMVGPGVGYGDREVFPSQGLGRGGGSAAERMGGLGAEEEGQSCHTRPGKWSSKWQEDEVIL